MRATRRQGQKFNERHEDDRGDATAASTAALELPVPASAAATGHHRSESSVSPSTPDSLAADRSSPSLAKRALEDIEKNTEGFLKENDFIDALYNPHTVTGLILLLASAVWTAFQRNPADFSAEHNIKLGATALALAFLVYCAFQLRDGLLVRPHPAFWRVVQGTGILYMMFLTFLLFQNIHDVRQWIMYIYPDLGRPLPERSYASDCRLYDPLSPSNPFHNLTDALFDRFVIAHIFGHMGKAIMLRDAKMTWVLSIFFEILEVTFQHWMPNFMECWWDHLIVDVLICNAAGLYLGVFICKWLDMKSYDWVGLDKIRSKTGKVRRIVGQMTPRSWTRYNWDVWSNPKRFGACFFILTLACVVDVNAFMLKFVLWITESKNVNIYRLFLWWFLALPAIREFYAYVVETGNRRTQRLGTNCWLAISCALLEILVVFKFAWTAGDVFNQPFPPNVKVPWIMFMVLFPLWVMLHYTKTVRASSWFMRALFLLSSIIPFSFLFVTGCPDWRFGEARFNNWWLGKAPLF